MRGWRGPFKVTEVHQGGRYYHLSNGNKAHYEIMKPHHSGIEEFEISVENEQQLVGTNPIMPELKGQLIMDDLSVDEVEVGELAPSEMEDLKEKADEIELDSSNQPDAPFGMKTRGKRRSYNIESSGSTHSGDSDDEGAYTIPGESADDGATLREADPDATEINFTSKPVPGSQVIQGDLFTCRQQKRKGYTYALAHCISADAAMAAGIAVAFCQHFNDLMRRVESETNVKASLVAIHFEEDDCWDYNLIRNQRLRITVYVRDQSRRPASREKQSEEKHGADPHLDSDDSSSPVCHAVTCDDNDVTLPYGMEERLSRHDLICEAEQVISSGERESACADPPDASIRVHPSSSNNIPTAESLSAADGFSGTKARGNFCHDKRAPMQDTPNEKTSSGEPPHRYRLRP